MNWKIAAVLTLVLAAALVAGTLALRKTRSQAPVTVTLRIEVKPTEQLNFVLGRANSAQFKYLVGKQSGVKPVLAQRSAPRAVPNTSLIEAQVAVQTKDQGQRYAEAFLPTLQDLCGRQAQLTLIEQAVR